jgi:hypothetical protein
MIHLPLAPGCIEFSERSPRLRTHLPRGTLYDTLTEAFRSCLSESNAQRVR